MNKLVVVNICIVLFYIFILVNLSTAKRGLRDCGSCRYLGETDHENEKCHKDKVKFRKLPQECSAYIYDGFIFDKNFEFVPKNSEEDFENVESLINLKGDDGEFHDVYVFFKHEAKDHLDFIFDLGDNTVDAAQIEVFVSKYPVKGFIIADFSDPFNFQFYNEFYTYFQCYVHDIKRYMPDLEIGFYLSARNFTEPNKNESSNWFDFGKMNQFIDFYLIEFTTFNECVDQLLYGGITPIDSADGNILTLNKFAEAFKNSTIDKEKVYFEFLINPMVKTAEQSKFMHCEISYNEYCENRDSYKSIWCVDTQDVLYEKGKFAKQYSKGFVGREIDLVDRDNKCNCDNKYITFHMMLRGYNNEDPLTCDAYA
ncbi:hypothetical protein QTP88_026946 [Uroleucon formosanum]